MCLFFQSLRQTNSYFGLGDRSVGTNNGLTTFDSMLEDNTRCDRETSNLVFGKFESKETGIVVDRLNFGQLLKKKALSLFLIIRARTVCSASLLTVRVTKLELLKAATFSWIVFTTGKTLVSEEL